MKLATIYTSDMYQGKFYVIVRETRGTVRNIVSKSGLRQGAVVDNVDNYYNSTREAIASIKRVFPKTKRPKEIQLTHHMIDAFEVL